MMNRLPPLSVFFSTTDTSPVLFFDDDHYLPSKPFAVLVLLDDASELRVIYKLYERKETGKNLVRNKHNE